MAVTNLTCRECGTEYALDGAVRLHALLRPARGRSTTTARSRGDVDVAAPPHPVRARRTSGATPTSCRSSTASPGPSARHAQPRRPARRLHAAGARPTASPSASASREVWVKNDAANPTHSFKDRVVAVAAARARELGFDTLACASTGNLANAVAAAAAALGHARPTSSSRPTSRSRRSSRPASTATNLVKVHGNYDDVNRLCTELSGEQRELGVRERQHAPVLRRGLQDARLRDRRAARLRDARTASSRRSPPARCSPRSPRASRSGASSA